MAGVKRKFKTKPGATFGMLAFGWLAAFTAQNLNNVWGIILAVFITAVAASILVSGTEYDDNQPGK